MSIAKLSTVYPGRNAVMVCSYKSPARIVEILQECWMVSAAASISKVGSAPIYWIVSDWMEWIKVEGITYRAMLPPRLICFFKVFIVLDSFRGNCP